MYPTGTTNAVAKKQTKTRQINVRVPEDLADRLDAAADLLATDASHLLRLMLVECLPAYEERGRKAREAAAPVRPEGKRKAKE